MSLSWIRTNKRVFEGIKLINSIDYESFTSLVNLLVECKEDESLFSDKLEEFRKLLSLNKDETSLVLKTTIHILNSMSQIMLEQETFKKNLTGPLQLSDEKANIFLNAWKVQTTNHFNSIEGKYILNDILWELNLQSASNSNSTQLNPSARIQLNLNNIIDNSNEERVINMNENDLIELCNTLEVIQSKIDTINDFYKH